MALYLRSDSMTAVPDCTNRRYGRSSDRVVLRIAAADLVAVAARAQAVVRPLALREHGADQIPAGPLVEPIARAERVEVGRVVEQIALQRRLRRENRIVDAQHGRVARGLERMRIGCAERPRADELRRAGEHAVARTLVEGLLRRRHVAPQPFVVGVELDVADAVVEAIAAADLGGPFVVNAGEDLRAVRQKDRRDLTRLEPIVAVAVG